MQRNAVIGYYTTKFGELWNQSLSDLLLEAVEGVLQETDLQKDQIEAIFLGNMLAGVLENNMHLNSKLAEILKVNIPIYRFESACASGGMAFNMANNYLQAGSGKTVLVIGVEKMNDYPSEDTTSALMGAASGEEFQAGLTFPGLYGMIAKRYLHEFNYDEEVLAWSSVKNHYHGSLNAKAHFKSQVNVEQVMRSTMVADPLRLLECSPISDGASSIILTSDPELQSKFTNKIEVLATEVATDSISLRGRENLTTLKATQVAADKAFDSANLKREDINVAELHDCFSIAELVAMEDIGFWKKGEAGAKIKEESTKLGSGNSLIVNTSGGLKASGHPVGATGIKQIGEVFLQLTKQAGDRQVTTPVKYGLTHNVGGSGGSAVVSIFGN
jgi:acetyl-CoA C-acetyltransferase